MRPALLVPSLALLLALSALPALPAEAKPFCTVIHPECGEYLVCLYPTEPDACVYDPCARVQCLRAGAGGPATPPPCMDRYWETGVGPVRIVSRSSCEYEVCWETDCRPLLE